MKRLEKRIIMLVAFVFLGMLCVSCTNSTYPTTTAALNTGYNGEWIGTYPDSEIANYIDTVRIEVSQTTTSTVTGTVQYQIDGGVNIDASMVGSYSSDSIRMLFGTGDGGFADTVVGDSVMQGELMILDPLFEYGLKRASLTLHRQ